MAIGDVYDVAGHPDLSYVDTGMYGAPEYGCVYLLDAERPAVVDAGTGATRELVFDAMDEVGIARDDLEVVAATHVHLDHAGGVGYLAEECPNATVHVHEIGAPHLVDPARLWEGTRRAVGDLFSYYAEPVPVPEDRIRELTGGDVIDLGDRRLEVRRAPGHAPHQVVFHEPSAGALFAADAAGIYVPALDRVKETSPPSNFDLEGCLEDVETCRALDPETLCYTHFGPAPVDDRLDEYESVLTEWVESVAAVRAEAADDDAVVDRFVDRAETTEVWGEELAAAETAMNTRGVLRYLDQRGG